MNKRTLLACLAASLFSAAICAHTHTATSAWSPAKGVLCDRFMCASDTGISRSLTEKYLGVRTATRLFSKGPFSLTEFTFANGIFCDVKERLCRMNRYYGADGKHSGAVSKRYTALLFGS
jgi:Fels-1 Prophage Protein-like